MDQKQTVRQRKQTFLGTVRPITSFAIDPSFKFKLVLPDGTSYNLLADESQQQMLKREIWEIFQIEGILLPEHIILVEDLLLHSCLNQSESVSLRDAS